MINRREFLSTTAVALARANTLFAARAKYDLIIKGGRVVDPSQKIDGVRDLAISNGRIAAIQPSVSGDATNTLDARGKIVTPGLIDIHTHAARVDDGPGLCLHDGVTGWIDAGSTGADNIAPAIAIAKASPQPGRLLINIGRKGVIGGGDTMDLANADVGAARDTIAKNRELIVGVKARLSRDVCGTNDYEVLRRAQEVVKPFNLPVMIHMGQTATPVSKLFELLKPGDIVTHMFAPPPNAIIDDNGKLFPEVLAARKRGVWFDVGNGRTGHLRWDIVEKVMTAGFLPDTFSTDWTVEGRTAGVIDFPNCLSKFLDLGMPLDQIIARATINPSRTFPVFRDRGTLKVGAAADVAVLELRDGSFEFVDNFKNVRTGKQRLFPFATVLNGTRVH